MSGPFETLETHDASSEVLVVTLARPQAANALNTQMARELIAVFFDLAHHASPYRCVVLTGSGTRAFCAGADLKERDGMSDAAWRAQHLVFEQMGRALLAAPMPVIAAVNGAAYGGGCEIALACDFIYAAEGARFALTETTLGIMPGLGGTQMLPRAIGARRAKEALFTGAPFSAADALAWGMVNRVCAPERLLEDAAAAAERIAAGAPLAIRAVKHAVDAGAGLDLKAAMAVELDAYHQLTVTSDRLEGVRAFNEKRKAVFRGA